MMLLEPLRRKRDRIAAKLRAGTTDKEELKAIKALIDDNDVDTYTREFLLAALCKKCGQRLADQEEWQSGDHEKLFNICVDLVAAETKAYQEAFAS